MHDNTGTNIECRIVLYYVSKEYITDGVSVYMWHEGSHENSWNGGREGKIMIFFFGWVGIHKNISTYMLYL